MSELNQDDALFDFPCDFPIKVMGRADDALELDVVQIIRRHVPDLSENAVTRRDSKQKNYASITVVIRATSRAQLDAIYRDLTSCEQILMVL